MTVLFNDEFVDTQITLNIDDRALQYGDGLFETIAIRNKEPRHLSLHLDRLRSGCKALGLKMPDNQLLISKIDRIIEHSKLDHSTVKLMLWRKSSNAQGYEADTDEVNVLIKNKPFKGRSRTLKKVDFASDIFFSYTPTSRFKTLNSLPYILAARERKIRNLDELIVLNHQSFICECVSSNIFWVKKQQVFTPKLETGCLDGVMRRFVIERLQITAYTLKEVEAKTSEILKADCVFTTNSAGVGIIKNIGGHEFAKDSPIVDLIIKAIDE